MRARRNVSAILFATSLFAQAPTAPVISPRGVTNYFTQEPAPGTAGVGSLVQIAGLNLGPVEGATADSLPWPTTLAGTQVVIGGKPAPIYSVTPGTIVAQVPVDSNTGLVQVVVRRQGVTSAPARVFVNPLYPAMRTADDTGFGAPWGKLTEKDIAGTASGLGPTDPKLENGDAGPSDKPALPTNPIAAYVGGLRAKVSAAASAQRPGEFDVHIEIPAGARAGDLITLAAGRQMANQTVYTPATAAEVQYAAFPGRAPAITALTDTGLNGNYLLATGARNEDGCYPALTMNAAAKSIAPVSDCLTSANANVQPLAVPANGDTIGALVGPPSGDAASGISSTVAIFSAAGDPLKITLPSAAAALTPTPNGFNAPLPGQTARVAAIDGATGEFEVTDALPAGAQTPVPGSAAAALKVDVGGLNQILANVNLGPGRIAVIVADDSIKPTKAAYAVVNADGEVAFSKPFPDGFVPALTAAAPPRPNQPNAPVSTPMFVDNGARVIWALARAADASKDLFLGFAFTDTDAKTVEFPEGWFVTTCTTDIRLMNLDLVRQIALVGSRVVETEFKASCPGSGFVLLDLAEASASALPVGDGGQIRVPAARNDGSMAMMNNYIYAAKLDSTRATTADTIYVLDGVSASIFTLPVPPSVTAFTTATLQQIPDFNSLLAQTFGKAAGDEGMVLFNLDTAKSVNLPLPDGFAAMNALGDGAVVCCLATRKIVGRATRQGASNVVIYDLVTGDFTVVANPEGVTSTGPPPGGGQAAPAAGTRLILANSRANTISAVAYNANRQTGIIVVRVP